jgi:hypothetical protein
MYQFRAITLLTHEVIITDSKKTTVLFLTDPWFLAMIILWSAGSGHVQIQSTKNSGTTIIQTGALSPVPERDRQIEWKSK